MRLDAYFFEEKFNGQTKQLLHDCGTETIVIHTCNSTRTPTLSDLAHFMSLDVMFRTTEDDEVVTLFTGHQNRGNLEL